MNDNYLENIYKSSLKFLVPLSLQDTYETIVSEAMKLVNGYDGVIMFRKKNGFEKVFSSSDLSARSKYRPRGFTYQTFKTHQARVMDRDTMLKAHPDLVEQGIATCVFIPLTYKEESIGVLIIRSKKEKAFSDKELSVLRLFGSFASVAIRKSQLYQETQDALAMRDLFISMASHELRTPITTIFGYTDLIRRRVKSGKKIDIKWLDNMHRENRRLIHLINELLEINQIRNGEMAYNFKEVNVMQIVQRATSNFKVQYPHREIHVANQILNGSAVIIADEEKVLQALENILYNSAKFSKESTPVDILLENKEKVLYITVRDKGVGIKRNKVRKVFEKFYKGNASNKEGMGLGLFLVKEIMQKHKGGVKIKSREHIGTEIKLSFPRINYGKS